VRMQKYGEPVVKGRRGILPRPRALPEDDGSRPQFSHPRGRNRLFPTRCSSPALQKSQQLCLQTQGYLATSSRKSVPPCAASMRPVRPSTAPVKAPRVWPKSSASSRPSGIAAQFRAISLCADGRSAGAARGHQLLAAAGWSFDQHGRRRAATRRILRLTSSIAGCEPTNSGRPRSLAGDSWLQDRTRRALRWKGSAAQNCAPAKVAQALQAISRAP